MTGLVHFNYNWTEIRYRQADIEAIYDWKIGVSNLMRGIHNYTITVI